MEMFPSGALRGPYFGKVTAATLVDAETPDLRRWLYDLEVVQLGENDWLDFDIVPEVSGVLNVFESGNTATTSMGITHASLPGTFQLQSCPTDTIVPFWAHPNGYVMMWPNQFDGIC